MARSTPGYCTFTATGGPSKGRRTVHLPDRGRGDRPTLEVGEEHLERSSTEFHPDHPARPARTPWEAHASALCRAPLGRFGQIPDRGSSRSGRASSARPSCCPSCSATCSAVCSSNSVRSSSRRSSDASAPVGLHAHVARSGPGTDPGHARGPAGTIGQQRRPGAITGAGLECPQTSGGARNAQRDGRKGRPPLSGCSTAHCVVDPWSWVRTGQDGPSPGGVLGDGRVRTPGSALGDHDRVDDDVVGGTVLCAGRHALILASTSRPAISLPNSEYCGGRPTPLEPRR